MEFRQKLANSDVTKEALNCTASLQQLTALLTPLHQAYCSVIRKQVLPESGNVTTVGIIPKAAGAVFYQNVK